MRAFSHRPALVVLGLFLTLLCLVGLRLGVKASALTETDIIEQYSASIWCRNKRQAGACCAQIAMQSQAQMCGLGSR